MLSEEASIYGTEPIIDPLTGWVLNPALPCVKGEGPCALRVKPSTRFEWVTK